MERGCPAADGTHGRGGRGAGGTGTARRGPAGTGRGGAEGDRRTAAPRRLLSHALRGGVPRPGRERRPRRIRDHRPAARLRRADPGRTGLPAGGHVHVDLRHPTALPAPQRRGLPGHGGPGGSPARPVLLGHRRGRRTQPRIPGQPAPGRRDRQTRPLRELHRRARPQPGARLDHRDVARAGGRLRGAHRCRPGRVRQQRPVLGPPTAGPAQRGGGSHRHHPGRGAHRGGTRRTPRAPVRRLRQRGPPRLGARRGRAADRAGGRRRPAPRRPRLRPRGHPEAAVRLGETDIYPASSPPARALREGRAAVSQAAASPTSCAGSPNATPAPR